VGLYDIRYVTDGASKIIQEYKPRDIINVDDVSVSGIDISRDKSELLVSYENDQVTSDFAR